VLDLSRVMAGPWAGQMLADLGADVIKVERPGAGDDTRAWGPPFLKAQDGSATRDAGYFLSVNRGKRSVTLELDQPEGQAVVKALAAASDILLENFKVGTLARYGLGYEDLRAINPRLIYCSITGFGQTGPRAPQAAYDFLIQAMGGLMSITGERAGRPGAGPQKVGVPIVDIMTGMYASVAVLAALARREQTGEGDWIDVGMLDVQAGVLANQAMNYFLSGRVPQRTGNAHPNIQPQDVFACADGELVIVVGNDGQFARLCQGLGEPALATDPRFAANADRVRHVEALRETLEAVLRTGTRQDWIGRLDPLGVPCGPINRIDEVFEDPQLRHRGMRFELPHAVAGSVPQVANPLRFRQSPIEYRRAPPQLGEHTVEVLRELGFDEATITRLSAGGDAR
jgi:crotonobetainyl-CoA:carnitine CoA-transferase CaiB-like acyl-CoA transferase